ncbi:hypothetical protein [Cloacibacterium normanense]|nr:hypothetical protein [Cloacibacterium normanense]
MKEMKNCIIISDSFNSDATGLVVKNLIQGITENQYYPNLITFPVKKLDDKINLITIPKNNTLSPNLSPKVDKLKMIIFKSLLDYSKGKNDLKMIKDWIASKVEIENTKFVLVISSGNVSVRLLRIGKKISETYNLPYIIHSTDPIPSPKPWGDKEIFRSALFSAIKPFYKMANLVGSSNTVMLEYQLSYMPTIKGKSFVLYNPVSQWQELEENRIERGTFLYLGSIYGKRDPSFLISQFLILIEKYNFVKLKFVGSDIDILKYNIPKHRIKNFEVISWTDNVEKYIASSEVLLDLNANIEKDVFLSSKLSKYLSYNRKILVMCAKESAPAILINDNPNIGVWKFQYNLDNFIDLSSEILNTNFSNWIYRKKLCFDFSAKNQTSHLIERIKKL